MSQYVYQSIDCPRMGSEQGVKVLRVGFCRRLVV